MDGFSEEARTPGLCVPGFWPGLSLSKTIFIYHTTHKGALTIVRLEQETRVALQLPTKNPALGGASIKSCYLLILSFYVSLIPIQTGLFQEAQVCRALVPVLDRAKENQRRD